MEKINSENLISSLFFIGFDKVESLLLSLIVAKLMQDDSFIKTFEYDDEEFCDVFNEYIRYADGAYQPVEDIDFDTLVPLGDKLVPLRNRLHINKKLIAYLSPFDFKDIVFRKIVALNDWHADNLQDYFCDKEREIISKIFGINEMYRRRAVDREIAYENIYNEEATELDNINFTSDFLSKIIARNEEAVRISVGYSYINWLKSFTDKYGDFSTLDLTDIAPIISEEDKKNINTIDIFYDVIDEYVTENRINIPREEEGDYSYQISYLGNGFKIGFIPGQGGVFYCETIIPDENTIDFTDIVEYTGKRTKTRKKTV